MISLGVVLVLVLARCLHRWLPRIIRSIPHRSTLMNGFSSPMEPNAFTGDVFWLGTDDQGRDVFSTILYGMRISLFVGFTAVLLRHGLGVTLGLIAGYVGGWTETHIMRVADVQLTFPAILVAMLIFGIAKGIHAGRHARRDGDLGSDHRHRPVGLGAVCPRRARCDSGRKEQGICAGRPADRPQAGRIMLRTSCPMCCRRFW